MTLAHRAADSGSQKAARAAAEAGGRARPGLGRQAAEAERRAPASRAAGAMTLFHFGNCFALAYFPYFITYKCSGL